MERFRIKIRPSWFSEDYIVLRYTTNGIFWKSVKEYEYDSLDKWCYMVTKISHFSNAGHLFQKFNTLEKIKQYEAEQKDKVRKHNKDISEKNKRNDENRNKVYKQYG